ncbi:hypothetical protein [Campylobacter fetus]|nr:hypothetical protein [Campylobacter fetus]
MAMLFFKFIFSNLSKSSAINSNPSAQIKFRFSRLDISLALISLDL